MRPLMQEYSGVRGRFYRKTNVIHPYSLFCQVHDLPLKLPA